MNEYAAVVEGQCQRKTKVLVEEPLQNVLPSGVIIILPLREKTTRQQIRQSVLAWGPPA